jgi:hypothetical protein
MKGPPSWHEPSATHLLAVAHEGEAAEARVLPLKLTDAKLEPGSERGWKAQPIPRWDGHFKFVVTHDTTKRYAVSQPSADGFTVTWAHVDDPSKDETVQVGATEPAALMLAFKNVIIGQGNTLAQVDFSEDEPAYAKVHERPEMKFKAYDLFVRRGDWLIAIDDMVNPVYADSFGLNGRGHLKHETGFSMPGIINGTYQHAALDSSRHRTGTLYAIAPYGIMDGNGHDLARLPVEEGKTTFDDDLRLNSTTHPHVLEEHVDRSSGKPTKLAAGSEVTDWTGLDLVSIGGELKMVLVAAGKRGLFVFPPDLGPETKAETVSLGAECHDVKVVGDRIFALVEGAVVELEHEAGKLSEVHRTAIAGGFHRWGR